jgi:serine/threonine-protein kinase
MIGATIGSYRVLAKLGEGGMGTVYVAEHNLIGRRAAIKVLLPAFSANQEIVARFFNEARALTAISDPGIVQLFDFGYHDGVAYIVMELLAGESMWERLQRVGRLAAIDAVRLMRQCAVSLAAAHGKGIIHRDLKPENLFVVGDPAVTGGERLKLLDFGVAKLAGLDAGPSRTRTGMMLGTPVYMSPEQCRSAPDIDSRSDIYSLGCVLFALLAGRPPFEYGNSGELIAAHLREPPPSLAQFAPELPPELDAIIQCCLAKEPAHRFASMHVVTGALDQAMAALLSVPHQQVSAPISLASSAVTTLGASTGQVAPAPRRAWRRVAVIGCAATISVAIGIAAFASGSTSSRPSAIVAAPPAPPSASLDAPAGSVIDAGVDASLEEAAAAIVAPPTAPAAGAPTKPRRVSRPRPRITHTTEEPSHGSNEAKPAPIDRGD